MASLALVLASALAARILSGRGLVSLAGLRFVGLPVVWVGACMELAVVSSSIGGTAAGLLVHGALATVVVFLCLNHRHPGLKLAAAGVLLNLAVVMANGAMPVAAESARSIAVQDGIRGFDAGHEEADEHTRLPLLADRIPVPIGGQVISIGDVLLLAGLGLFVARAQGAPRKRSETRTPVIAPAGAE